MEKQASRKASVSLRPCSPRRHRAAPFADNRIFLDFNAYPDGPNGGELLRLLHAVVGQALSPQAARFAAEQDEPRSGRQPIGAAVKTAGPNAWSSSLSRAACLATSPRWVQGGRRVDQARRPRPGHGGADDARARFPQAVAALGSSHALVLVQRARATTAGGRSGFGSGHPGRALRGWRARSGNSRHLRRDLDGALHAVRSACRSEASRDLYAEAFQVAQDDYYTGINAAAKSVFIGLPTICARRAIWPARCSRSSAPSPPRRLLENRHRRRSVPDAEAVRRRGGLTMPPSRLAPDGDRSHKSTWLQVVPAHGKLSPRGENGADPAAVSARSFAQHLGPSGCRARIPRSQAERSAISSAHTECGMRYSCHSTR